MKKILVASPEMIPPELASDPDLIVIDPAQLSDECVMALDEASGGLLSAGGPLTDWAGEEEREHAEGDDADDPEKRDADGRGDDEEDPEKRDAGRRGRGDEDDEDKDKPADAGRRGRGYGDDEDEEKKRDAEGRGRGLPRGRLGGRGGPPIMSWARRALGG